MNNSAVGIFMVIAAVIIGAGWLGLYVYHKKTGRPWTFETVNVMKGIVVLLCAAGAMAWIGLSNANDSGWWLEQATADKTPAQVFLRLTAESTEEELQRISEEQGLYVVKSNNNTGKTNLYYVMVDPNYLSYQSGKGVLLCAVFSPDTGMLDSAELTIRTDAGTARCNFIGSEDGADEYTLSVKTKWYIPKQTYHLQNAEDVIRIAYERVYPNGL